MSDSERAGCWETFYSRFEFRPRISEDYAGIREPIPSMTFDISIALAGDDECLERFEIDLNLWLLRALRSCGLPTVFAMDWQHPCYLFSPNEPFAAAQHDAWKISAFPYGDYHIFASRDFSLGTFGHPWKSTICVWGQSLLDLVDLDPPDVFNHRIRRNGLPF